MKLGEILVARGLVTTAAVRAALDVQRQTGGRLGGVLVEMGALTADQLQTAMASISIQTPRGPSNIAETGIPEGKLVDLLLKFMLVESREAISDLARAMRLPFQIAQALMNQASARKLVQALGAGAMAGAFSDVRYTLTLEGRAFANEALRQNQYIGPAPVTLEAFRSQINKQKIGKETVSVDQLREGMRDLVMSEHLIRKLLPAINSGRTILLFGPSGNGKTTVASRIAHLFRDIVFIPHAVEIAGQIMTVFDQTLHEPMLSDEEQRGLADAELGGEMFDDRWVACRRPFGMAGGELTLDMLDMKYDVDAHFYDAPLHVKVLNGVFLIDDFGRQQVSPAVILNRWIVPMESRVDFLRLHTGKSFGLPFDQLLIFSTNIDPHEIMDPALLRRMTYKVLLSGPNEATYRALFHEEAEKRSLTLPEDVLDFIIEVLTQREHFGLAYFQARFVCDQVGDVCEAFKVPRVITRQLVLEALSNLYVQIETDSEPEIPAPPLGMAAD